MLFFIALCIWFVVMGCSTVHRAISYYDACKGDVECMQKQENSRVLTQTIVAKAVDSVPGVSPLANTLGYIAGNLASALVGMIYGRKVSKNRGVK